MNTESTEKVTIEVAFQRFTDICSKLSERLSITEAQVEENRRNVIDHHQEITSEISKLSQEISNRIKEIQTEVQECSAIIKGGKMHQQLDEEPDQELIFNRTTTRRSGKHEIHFDSEEEEQNSKLDWKVHSSSTPPPRNISFSAVPVSHSPKANATNATAAPQATTIVIPSSTNIPTFSGKYSERPKQFLIRVQEYAETVHNWNQSTLLTGISQFLRDTALEWYCQLRASHRRPHSWIEFVTLFLAQFNSPIRSARQQQEWHECKQRDNETINEFLVRLRAIWMEQKPKESEADLVKHLLCRMRSDLLSMLGVSRNATLDDIIVEAQKVEEILYHRYKAQRKDESARHSSLLKATSSLSTDYQNSRSFRPPTFENSNPRRFDTRDTDRPNNMERFRTNSTRHHNNTHYERQNPHRWNTVKCYNCGLHGHSTGHCQNTRSNNPTTSNQVSKNEYRALAERDNNARTQEIPFN